MGPVADAKHPTVASVLSNVALLAFPMDIIFELNNTAYVMLPLINTDIVS